MTRIWDKLRRILIRSRGFSMQTGLQLSRTHLMQPGTATQFPRCFQIGQAALIGCFMLLGLNASPVNSQEAQVPAPNAEILPLESSRITLRVGSQGTQVAELQAMLKLLGYYSGVVNGVYQESTAIAVTAFQRAAGLTPDGVVGPGTWGRLLPASPSVSGASSATGAIAPSASSPAIPESAETTAATLAFPMPSSVEPTATPSAAAANATETASAASNPTPAASAGNAEVGPSAQPTSSSAQATAQSSVDLPILRLGMRGPAVTRLQERLRATGFFNGTVDGVFGTETQNAVRAAQRNSGLESDGVVGPATWDALLR
jgi:peptidoglycan hydrolase-like protein with peptidoglycan-binding domain